ncbi:hypothetical protein [Puniceibacterium sp. IMCC21224]|uniref:hypothetical protein n=1 Tax=Puniceibacterium sp. IMCC21224 TaxID=1618204 RepID=UPI00064D9F95|nr:hypothetical protein [Puniceibacterium sp. IMCC21224]KMK68762.1 hypothetical protein IMCC21224_113648 [Puniceibacterium sp. IMCC21224]
MTRLVIHAGFHKTGTTSVQSMIAANRDTLAPLTRCYLRDDFANLTEAARRFSISPDATALENVLDAATEFFDNLDPQDPRAILMSSEDLSGHLPGRHGLDRYDAAALILSQVAEAAHTRFGATLDLTFHFSTRSADAWLRSTWWQNLRSTRMTRDLDDYARTIAAAADHSAILQDVASAVAPDAVTCQPLEETGALPQGPLTPLLDLLGIDAATRATLTVLPPNNVQPDIGLDQVFLALNRSGLRHKQVKEAKRSLRRMAEHTSPKG